MGKKLAWLLVLPAVALLLIVIIFPLIYAAYTSFFSWPPFGEPFFAGFTNYQKLSFDARFFSSLGITFKLLTITLPVEFTLGLVFALALSKIKRFRGLLLSYLLIPSMLAPIAAGIVWFTLFTTRYGAINYFVEKIFGVEPIPWLSSANWALLSIAIADIWEWTPFVMAIMLAGILSIPQELYEAAETDGASPIQTFRRITLPLLKTAILVAVLIRTIDLMRIFELPYLITQGGPGNAKEVLSFYIYRVGFKFWEMPYASVLSFVMLGLIIGIVTTYIRTIRSTG
jgi:multiple sugar transport system permease protein